MRFSEFLIDISACFFFFFCVCVCVFSRSSRKNCGIPTKIMNFAGTGRYSIVDIPFISGVPLPSEKKLRFSEFLIDISECFFFFFFFLFFVGEIWQKKKF
jgi:hypothetical protein